MSLTASKADGAFVSCGYTNWKDATVSFRKHELTECHRAAIEAVATLPNQVDDNGESLSKQLSEDKAVYYLKYLETSVFLHGKVLHLEEQEMMKTVILFN